MSESWGFETKQVHAGASPDPTTGARAVPIYQTTSYVFRDTAHAAALFGLEELGNIYTRIMNPTQAVFEDRMTALEGGVGALATASGQAAQFVALANLAENGGHIVSSASLYGGTYNQLHYTFPKLGMEVSFVDDPDDLDAWAAAVRPNTRAFYGETIGNPKGDVFDFEGVSKVAHDNNIPLLIDSTLASPYLCRPLEHGADIVVHSATKFIGGHGTSIGGIIVDGGKFDYAGSGRFANFTEPDPSYHGAIFSQLPEPLRPAQYILKARLQYQRDIGAALSPFNSFLFLQGLQTLSLRMERHSQNALTVAKWLEGRPELERVFYPGLSSHPDHEIAARQMTGFGGVVSFIVKGGLEGARRVVDRMQIARIAPSFGGVDTLVEQPAVMSFYEMTPEERRDKVGIADGLVRLAVGIEEPEDLIADLERALA